MPAESNRLGDLFGHIMNYGDGVYGGMFVAGMYTAAYFEERDVEAVVRQGLKCIPPESQYYQCIADVLRWHAQDPEDWRATWQKLEEKWQDNIDCRPDHAFNIDAKINGAYIALGLLYGNGDMDKTLEIATRCGQDADCNPSNAAGVLGCMKGYAALGESLTGGIPAIQDRVFSHTRYSFSTLIPACQRVTEAIIRRAGGRVEADAYIIPLQQPQPPAGLEQWENQMETLSVAASADDMQRWNPAWTLVACGMPMDVGVLPGQYGRGNILALHPVSRTEPAVITAELDVPDADQPRMTIDSTSNPMGDCVLRVYVDDTLAQETLLDAKGKWGTIEVDLGPYAGRRVEARVEVHSNDWKFECAYISKIEVH
jgi:hypothetical protein